MLENQLRRLGIFGAEETINSHPNFDESFKICEHVDYSYFSSTSEHKHYLPSM